MRGETARLAGDLVPVHPDQEGNALTGPPSTPQSERAANGNARDDVDAGGAARSDVATILPRRSGSEKRQRTVHFAIRLAPDERVLIEDQAERAGLSVASYARQTLLEAPAPRQVRRPPIERRELARLFGQLGAIGNNLNQIARVLNCGDEADLHALDQAVADLQRMRDAALKALGRES